MAPKSVEGTIIGLIKGVVRIGFSDPLRLSLFISILGPITEDLPNKGLLLFPLQTLSSELPTNIELVKLLLARNKGFDVDDIKVELFILLSEGCDALFPNTWLVRGCRRNVDNGSCCVVVVSFNDCAWTANSLAGFPIVFALSRATMVLGITAFRLARFYKLHIIT